jgi:hypothetical protein
MSPFQYIYLFLLIISFLISLFQYVKYGQAYQLKLICCLLGIGVLAEIVQFYMKETSSPYTGFIYHIYNPAEYVMYALIYFQFCKNLQAKRILKASIPIYLLFALLFSTFIYKVVEGQKDTHNHIVGDILKVILPLYYLYELYNDDNQASIVSLPMFWISVGNLFFFSLVAIFMSVRVELQHLDKALERTLYFWLNTIPNYIMYVMYIIGLLCYRPSNNLS